MNGCDDDGDGKFDLIGRVSIDPAGGMVDLRARSGSVTAGAIAAGAGLLALASLDDVLIDASTVGATTAGDVRAGDVRAFSVAIGSTARPIPGDVRIGELLATTGDFGVFDVRSLGRLHVDTFAVPDPFPRRQGDGIDDAGWDVTDSAVRFE